MTDQQQATSAEDIAIVRVRNLDTGVWETVPGVNYLGFSHHDDRPGKLMLHVLGLPAAQQLGIVKALHGTSGRIPYEIWLTYPPNQHVGPFHIERVLEMGQGLGREEEPLYQVWHLRGPYRPSVDSEVPE